MSEKRAWTELSTQQQLALREAFGHYLDGLPPSCSLERKIERFREWLAQREIEFSDSDLHT